MYVLFLKRLDNDNSYCVWNKMKYSLIEYDLLKPVYFKHRFRSNFSKDLNYRQSNA